MFLGLQSVAYQVDDLEKGKEWYSRVFEADPMVEEETFVAFFVGGQGLILRRGSGGKVDAANGAIAYWGVSDINAEFDRLLSFGATEHSSVTELRQGVHLAAVRDPFGNIFGIRGMSGRPDNEAIETKPSRTALWTTLMRAYAAGEEIGEIRGPDTVAEIFLPGDQAAAIRDPEGRQRVKEQDFVIGVYEYVMARTRFFDQCLGSVLREGIDQLVFLGAGFDSRPYRFINEIGRMRVFELDVPPTLDHKKRCLAKAGIAMPEGLQHVPINFNTQSLKEVLDAAGYDPDGKTLFMWEGVTYYLAADAVEDTLAFIKGHSPAGSSVVFDYIALWPGIMEAYGVKELIEFNSRNQSGERGGYFSLEQGTIGDFLSNRGFEIVERQRPADLERNYLTLPDGTLFGNVTGSFRMVQARNKSEG